MAPLALSLLLLLLVSYSSSTTLLTPAAAVCAPRSCPYQFFFDHFLQPPAGGVDATDYEDDDDSPSPSQAPSSSVKSPAPAPASPKTTLSPAPVAPKPKPSAATSPSPAPKASAPVAPTPKPSAATSPSPAPKASAPVVPTPATSPSPAPKASAPAAATPKPSTTTSPSPATPAQKPSAATTSPSPAPKATTPAPAPASSSVESVHAKAVGAVAGVAAGVSSALSGGVLDPSLKPICAMVPYPSICEGNVKAAAAKSVKSVDVRSAFKLMMEAYTDEIREIRDKSRALVTSDLYSDPLNMCNRSLGGMLRTSKEMVASFERDDSGSLKSGMDSLVSSLMSCKEKATVIQSDMVRLYNIWDNIEAIFEKLYPALDPHKMFPRTS